MTTTDPIPDEAVEAAARAIFDVRDDPYDTDEWEDLDSSDREPEMCQARAALTAAAPIIAAQATADLRARIEALWDEWSERTVTVIPSSVAPASIERLTWAAAADALDALIGGA